MLYHSFTSSNRPTNVWGVTFTTRFSSPSRPRGLSLSSLSRAAVSVYLDRDVSRRRVSPRSIAREPRGGANLWGERVWRRFREQGEAKVASKVKVVRENRHGLKSSTRDRCASTDDARARSLRDSRNHRMTSSSSRRVEPRSRGRRREDWPRRRRMISSRRCSRRRRGGPISIRARSGTSWSEASWGVRVRGRMSVVLRCSWRGSRRRCQCGRRIDSARPEYRRARTSRRESRLGTTTSVSGLEWRR